MFPYDEYVTVSMQYELYNVLNTEYRRLWLNWTAFIERAFDKHELKIILMKRIKLTAVRALT